MRMVRWPFRVALGVLACVAVAVGAQKKGKLEVKVTDSAEECTDRVVNGDVAHILHQGFLGEQKIDQNENYPDGTPEPLKVAIGKHHVLAGMELAIEGMCLGEEIEVRIPPHLAYDDPTKKFANKPVPPKSWVRYKIRVVDIDHPGTWQFFFKNMTESILQLWPLWLLVAGLLVAPKIFGSSGQSKQKEGRAAREALKKSKRS